MAKSSTRSKSRVFAFGSFRLLPEQQALLNGDLSVRVGARQLELLLALVEKPGEVVTKQELIARVWPDGPVDAGNLKVNIATLRKALGDVNKSPQYIATVSGRGYKFVAEAELIETDAYAQGLNSRGSNVPTTTIAILGRESAINELSSKLEETRLLTVTGPGGIGKTTTALAVARAIASRFESGVWYVDLASLGDPKLIPRAIASTAGLTIHSDNILSALAAFLKDSHLLVVLDNCEHLIDDVAQCVDQLLTTTKRLHLLATSRERLRISGEFVYRLPPLAMPEDVSQITAKDALRFPAIQLFVERASASGNPFKLTDRNAPTVSAICRSLDGIALAIELAASRANSLGPKVLLSGLSERFKVLDHGRQTPSPRHRTLYDTIDWSYRLLTDVEQRVLQSLSIFTGTFSLHAAVAIASGGGVEPSDVMDATANLVSKSLALATSNGELHYRLLETTRAYARGKLAQMEQQADISARYARFFFKELNRAKLDLSVLSSAEWLDRYTQGVDDVRCTFEWTFSASNNSVVDGVKLAVAAIPFWSRLSLLDECLKWVDRALSLSSGADTSNIDLMKLHEARGASLLYTQGPSIKVRQSFSRALRLAEVSDKANYQVRCLWGLGYTHLYGGRIRFALESAKRLQAIADSSHDLAGKKDGERIAAVALHYMGKHLPAADLLRHLDRGILAPEKGARLARFQLDHRISVHSTLAHLLFVTGRPDTALRRVSLAIDEAIEIGHSVSLGSILVLAAIPIAIYRRDIERADTLLAMLKTIITNHGLVIWRTMADCLAGALQVMRNDPTGLDSLAASLDVLRDAKCGVRYAFYMGILGGGLATAGQSVNALKVINTALSWSARHEENWCVPELLRIKGCILIGSADAIEADQVLKRSIHLSRKQGALGFEIRAAVDMARLLQASHRQIEAKELLSSVYGRFEEGFDTADLMAANALLAELTQAPIP